MPWTTDENGWPVWTDTPAYVPTINTTDEYVTESGGSDDSAYIRQVANPNYVAPKPTTLEGMLQKYNQSNFDIGSTAALIRQLGQQSGLSEAELVAAVPVFGDEHRAALNSGYTEGSNYNAIAQRAVADALRTRGTDPSRFNQATQGFVDQGTRQAQQRWQATQEDDSGGLFGDLGPLAKLAALIPGPQQPFLLAANAANSLSQGDLIGAGLNAFGAYTGFGDAGGSLGDYQSFVEPGTSYGDFQSFVDPGTSYSGEGSVATPSPLEPQIPTSPEPGLTPPVAETPSPLQSVKDFASNVSDGLSSAKSSILNPVMETLAEAGIPSEIVQRVPALASKAALQLATTGDVNLENLAGGELSNLVGSGIAGETGSNLLGKVASNVTNSAVQGRDPLTGLMNLGIDEGVNAAVNYGSGLLDRIPKTETPEDTSVPFQEAAISAPPAEEDKTIGGLNVVKNILPAGVASGFIKSNLIGSLNKPSGRVKTRSQISLPPRVDVSKLIRVAKAPVKPSAPVGKLKPYTGISGLTSLLKKSG